MAVIRILLFFGTALFMLAEVQNAPAKYDQRQEGNFNLHAQLENLLLIAVIPGNNELLNELALQALEFKQQLSRSNLKEQESIKSIEEQFQDEPYILEVIQINENQDKKNFMQNDEKISNNSNLTSINDTQGEKAKHVDRIAKNMKDFEFPKNREVPVILGYLVDTRKIPESKTEDGGQARNILRNPDVDPEKLRISLKKQLFRKKEENIAPLSSIHENNTNLISVEKKQELRLLGDSVENCGPGRYRDAAGICQFDESVGSLL